MDIYLYMNNRYEPAIMIIIIIMKNSSQNRRDDKQKPCKLMMAKKIRNDMYIAYIIQLNLYK